MTANALTAIEKVRLRARLSQGFSPSAPINRFELFAGRAGQVKSMIQAIGTRGNHAILYGERGVGKTSLVTVLREIYAEFPGHEGAVIVKVSCKEDDTFTSVWKKMLCEIDLVVENEYGPPEEIRLSDLMGDDFNSSKACRICAQRSQGSRGIILIFDEFDCMPAEHRSNFAPTIKELSDNSIETTIILVGVAADVKGLIEKHQSVDRCLKQILMPTMTHDEIVSLIDKVLAPIGMTMENEAKTKIVMLAQGLPHYAHLLGQEASFLSVDAGRKHVTTADVDAGIANAIANTLQSTRNDYQTASEGQRKGTLFPQVLLACAVAPVDDLGYFSSADIREPLRQLTGESYDIPSYAQHLNKLSTDETRGPVLERLDLGYRLRFRFLNPLLRPFILMKGLVDGKLDKTLLGHMGSKPAGETPLRTRRVTKKPVEDDLKLF